MPKFSIIVGIYNQAATLPALIESLKRQTFKDFEVHFCDDGSDDGTESYFLEQKELVDHTPIGTDAERDMRFPFYYHRQEHKGMRLAKNINQGISAAKGQYCLFVMGDSMLEENYLEVLAEYVAENRIVCGSRIQIAPVAGKMVGVDIDWRLKKQVIPEFATVLTEQPWNALTGNGLTIPTSALRKYGPWDERIEGYGGEDNEIVARLFYKGYLCWSIPELHLYHHWHKGAESQNNSLVASIIKEYAN